MPFCTGEKAEHSGKRQRGNHQNAHTYCVRSAIADIVDEMVEQIDGHNEENEDHKRDDRVCEVVDTLAGVVYFVARGFLPRLLCDVSVVHIYD